MKKIISLTLAALMLVTVLLLATSCGMESMTGYTRLRDHIKTVGGDEAVIRLDAAKVGLTSAAATVVTTEEGDEYVCLVGYTVNTQSATVYQLGLNLTGSPEKAELVFEVLQSSTAKRIAMGTATVRLTHYTGDEFVTFTDTEGIAPSGEFVQRQNATILLNAILTATDVYTTDKMDMNLRELGFIALSDKYMADVDETVTEEDLGGAFSPERLSMAGLMIVQGMGMVFLVLAILWLVLLVFKKVFYKDPAKTEKKTEKTADTVPSAVAVPAPADDGQLVAAITAAVAAYIESDPALSSQFAGGFRVVSFKKKNGKTSWNH
jgi:sodium pump decarboxylase gamma subunit